VNSEPLVAIRGLTVDFDDGRRLVRVLHGVDLEVGPGEALGLVGESGCGKSVTWLAALGLLGKRAQVGGQVPLTAAISAAPVAEPSACAAGASP
jgi:peptide/nickel transport system ATP-binding protein